MIRDAILGCNLTAFLYFLVAEPVAEPQAANEEAPKRKKSNLPWLALTRNSVLSYSRSGCGSSPSSSKGFHGVQTKLIVHLPRMCGHREARYT
jgi:hypothetical protein